MLCLNIDTELWSKLGKCICALLWTKLVLELPFIFATFEWKYKSISAPLRSHQEKYLQGRLEDQK